MHLTESDNAAIQGKTIMVAGGFDPLHEGHVAYFQAAADLGAPQGLTVVCSVDPDDYVATRLSRNTADDAGSVPLLP